MVDGLKPTLHFESDLAMADLYRVVVPATAKQPGVNSYRFLKGLYRGSPISISCHELNGFV
jgi:hypothetical protein